MRSICCAVAALSAALPALADDVIYSTGDPFNGPMGVTGFDIHPGLSAAIRFQPAQDCTLTSVSLWLMSHTPAGTDVSPTLALSLRADALSTHGVTGPAPSPLHNWLIETDPTPYTPERYDLTAEAAVQLEAGRSYWIVAESTNPLGHNPIWTWSGQHTGYIALRNSSSQWECDPGIALTVEVRATPTCSADFDNDGDSATDADIEAFFACLAGNCCQTCQTADFNHDGDTATDADIESFFRVLAGGAC